MKELGIIIEGQERKMNKTERAGQEVKRASYVSVLKVGVTEEAFKEKTVLCRSELETAFKDKVLLTASLFKYESFLFLYTEGVGDIINPQEICPSLNTLLQAVPGSILQPQEKRLWIYMQPYYYHDTPKEVADWMEERHPQLRRGRIALLAPDKWEEYMQYHFQLMQEGSIEGDRYHLISVHENLLFSYFEEPKTMRNLCGKQGAESQVLARWLQTDPEGHFMRFAPGQGSGPDGNFVFLDCVATI